MSYGPSDTGSNAYGNQLGAPASTNAKGSRNGMGIENGMGIGAGAAPAEDGSLARAAAPLGVTPPPPAPVPVATPPLSAQQAGAVGEAGRAGDGNGAAAGQRAVTWYPGCGRKARSGDVVGDGAVTLTNGCTVGRRERVDNGPLTYAEAKRLFASLIGPGRSAGARIVLRRSGIPLPVPSDSSDRSRAVGAWTRRLIGKRCGVIGVVRGLRRHRLWSRLLKYAERENARCNVVAV